MISRLGQSPAPAQPAAGWLTRWRVVVLTVLFGVLVTLVIAVADRLAYRRTLREWEERLTTLSQRTVELMDLWLAERTAETGLAASFPSVARALGEAVHGHDPALLTESVEEHLGYVLGLVRAAHQAAAVFVLDRAGRPVHAQGDVSLGAATLAALAARAPTPADVEVDGRMLLAFVAPVPRHGVEAQGVAGFVVMVFDAVDFLSPRIAALPLPFRDVSTLIVKRHGRDVAVLLQQRQGQADLPLRRPAGAPDLDAAAALAGPGRFGIFRTFEGTTVLAAVRPLPLAGWGVVHRVDLASALAGHRADVWRGRVVGAASVVAFAALLLAVSRRREARGLQAALAREREVRELESRYWRVIDQANDALLIVGADGRIAAANRRARELYGYTDAEIPSLSVADLAAPGSAPVPAATPDEAALQADGVVAEVEHRRRDGSRFLAQVSARAVDLDGARVTILAVRDITAVRRAEEAVRESEARFRALFDHAAVAMCLATPDGVLVEVNEALCAMAGVPREQLVGRSFLEFAHPETHEAARRRLATLWRGEVPSYTAETRYITPDGRPIWARISVASIRDADGQPRYVTVVVDDITAQRAATEALQRLNLELEARVAERTAALEAANAELSSFNYSVSHDLRAPLRHIEGFARLLEEDYAACLPPEGRQYLERVRAGCVRLNQLLDALLRLVRVGRAEVHVRRVSLADLVRATVDELLSHETDRKPEVLIGDLPKVTGDPVLLRELLDNLIGNALKFTRPVPRARIEIGVEPRNGQPVFFVRDNGVGFDPARAHELFQAFQRLHGPDEFAGTGIGLSIVKRIVEKHGGRVWAEGWPGQGATVYFTLGEPEGAPAERREPEAADPPGP